MNYGVIMITSATDILLFSLILFLGVVSVNTAAAAALLSVHFEDIQYHCIINSSPGMPDTLTRYRVNYTVFVFPPISIHVLCVRTIGYADRAIHLNTHSH